MNQTFYHKFKHKQAFSVFFYFFLTISIFVNIPLAQAITPLSNEPLSAKSGLHVRAFILDGISLPRATELQTKMANIGKDIGLSNQCQFNLKKKFNEKQVRAKLNAIYPQDVDKHLQRIAVLFVNCYMSAEQIQALKNRITRYYVKHKYLNSGAIIPDQEVHKGVIVMRIIEGWLSEVEIENANELHLDSAYIKRRLLDDEQSHLNMGVLQERLQIMQQNPLFKQITGRLAPGDELGEGILKVNVVESNPYQINFKFNNHRPPSVGAYRGVLEFLHHNVFGWGDGFFARYGLTAGLNDYSFNYHVPFRLALFDYDTTFLAGFAKTDSEVVSEPFKELGVKSDSKVWSVSLRQPLFKSYPSPDPNPHYYQEFALALKLENRNNVTFLEDKPFNFSRGAVEGETEFSVIRLSPEYLRQGRNNVIAFYNTFSFGINTFGSTIDTNSIDRQFITWLGQFQWFGRLNQWDYWARTLDSNLRLRTNIQIANKELLSLEKMAFGGYSSVRGYREGQLLRDSGIFTSLEWHIPIGYLVLPWSPEPGEGKIYLMPFFDYGKGWNASATTSKDISSVGLGLRWSPSKNIHAQLYWAKALVNVKSHQNQEHDLQDEGFHFEIRVNLWPW